MSSAQVVCHHDPSRENSLATPCFGVIRCYSEKDARQRGFLEPVSLCLRHAEALSKQHHRCAIVNDRDRCSGGLRACPERLLSVLNDVTHEVAAYLCAKHFVEADSLPEVIDHSFYQSPAKRVAAVAPLDVSRLSNEALLQPARVSLKISKQSIHIWHENAECSRRGRKRTTY